MPLPIKINPLLLPYWKPELTNEEYHADKTSVGSSTLKKILKSPRSFYAAFTGETEVKQTPEMQLGTLLHMALLEPEKFKKRYVLEPVFSGKTKDGRDSTRSADAKKAKDEWKSSLDANSVIVSEDEMKSIQGMIESVSRHRDAKDILKYGIAEISGFYADPSTGIQCKIRPDFILERVMAVVDLKTTEDCSKEAFSRTIWNYQYHIQMGMYCAGIELICGKKIEYPLYLVVERKPPYECAVYVCDEALLTRGKLEYELCLKKLKQCLDKDEWNFYQKKMDTISLPNWVSEIKEIE